MFQCTLIVEDDQKDLINLENVECLYSLVLVNVKWFVITDFSTSAKYFIFVFMLYTILK